ncbi:MAG: TRAP transporter large permease [Treponema sp.]|nr:TRAP transporter large permease [Treponema sp.]
MIFTHPMFPIAVLFILFFMNVPIALSLIGSTLYYFVFINDNMPTSLVIQQFVSAVESFPYLAVPFFIMLGSVMNYSGLSDSLMDFAEVLAGHLKGGLAQVNCVLSALMGGISGSANADAAMESKILVPAMLKKGMPLDFSAAVTASSSAVSPVIPPGNNLIMYALISGVTVGDMFLAGYTPGILMTIALMITVYIIAVKRGYAPSREKRATPIEVLRQAFKSIFALCIPFVIILGMRLGVCTPSEAGGVAVLFAFVIGVFAHHKLKLHHIPLILKETVQSTGSVMIIIAAAKAFGFYMSCESIPEMITTALLGLTENKFLLLMVINVVLLVVGMFIEGGAALIILAPLLVPAVMSRGVDPLHFGVIIIVNIMIGGLTPPFGSMMFTVCSIVNCRFDKFVKQVWPFIVALIIVLVLVTYSENVALAIPKLFGYVPIHTGVL